MAYFYEGYKRFDCIFGVDKDYNAVEACKFGLLLKLLENEDKREDTEEVKENVEQNKEKVKQISFDFPISDLDEARIVREFNTLEDN